MVYTILGIFLVLVVNLIHTNLVADKKYSNLTVFITLFLITAGLLGLVLWVGFVEGTTIRTVLIGFIFLIPLYFLYDVKFVKLISIFIYCWTYTMAVGVIAYGITGLFASDNSFQMILFFIQLGIIIISFPYVIKYTKNKFKVILDKSNNDILIKLILLEIFVFSAFVIIRYYFDTSNLAYLILSIIVGAIAYSSYILFFVLAESSMKLESANQKIYIDSLTGINNRFSLLKDMSEMINTDTPFILLFMDLDKLKSVNDNFSHEVGDKYLIKFADCLKHEFHNLGTVYRYAGDEFICLVTETSVQIDTDNLESKISAVMNEEFDFIGVSIGKSRHPEHGKDPRVIINEADESMYRKKRDKKITLAD